MVLDRGVFCPHGVLFSLYINSLLSKLTTAEVDVKCRDQLILALLYADDMVMLVEDDEMMRRALIGKLKLDERYTEWAVRVNVDKCRIMHVRKKGVKRSQQKFVVNREAVQNVVEYKYLGCIINEYALCSNMLYFIHCSIILSCVLTGGVVPPYVFPRYLRQVQDELLRVSTLAPFATRFSDEEVVVGGYTLPPKVRH